jgi:hypothetical protein
MTEDTTPEAVERFDLEQPTEHMGSASMDPAPGYGDWVRYSDYAALSVALEAEKARVADKHEAAMKGLSVIITLEARAEAAEAKVARLQIALSPFSKMASELFARNYNQNDTVLMFTNEDQGAVRLVFSDFLVARAALRDMGVE